MYTSTSARIRNIEMPENLFSNLGEHGLKKTEEKNIIKEKNINVINQTPTKTSDFRERITKMYQEFNNIIPIDNEIDNVLYFDNYTEKGIVIKPKLTSLKQFWTEYRLIDNEKNLNESIKMEDEKKEYNYDRLFDELSKRISEINKYIDELKLMKNEMKKNTLELEKEKEDLANERKEFNNYKLEEENKIKEKEATLKINFERLQTIIDDLDKKLGSIE